MQEELLGGSGMGSDVGGEGGVGTTMIGRRR